MRRYRSHISFRRVVAGVFLLSFVGCTDQKEPPPELASVVDVDMKSVKDVLTQRGQLDATLFANEVQAQEYEQAFVRLWDDLRADDPYRVLAGFPFETLIVPKLGGGERKDWGAGEIRSYRPKDTETLDHAQYETRLRTLSRQLRIVQTEWHHSKFEPASDGKPARSIVSAELHVAHARGQLRFVVRSKLTVEWSDKRDRYGHPVPRSIDATETELFEKRGKPMFEHLMTVDPSKIPPADRAPGIFLLLYDLNGDGLTEIILAGPNLVYWNRGGGQFDQAEFLADGSYWLAAAGILADFDGDRRTDFLAIPVYDGLLRLYKGDGLGRFPSIPRKVFDQRVVHAQVLSAGDVDSDGDLDLFVGQWKPPYFQGAMPTPFYDALDGPPDYLLENDGKGNFKDITERALLSAKRHRRTYSSSLVDLDDDGDLDLMAVCDFAGLDLYRNDGGGYFSDVTDRWVDERHAFGMAHTLGDFDGDGQLDFYMIGMSSTTARRLEQLGLHRPDFEDYAKHRMPMAFGNRMYLARGGRFVAPKHPLQVARTGWSWGCTSTDFDNDGDADIYVANGHISGKSSKDYCTRYWCHDIYAGSSENDVVLDQFFKEESKSELGEISWNGYEHNVLYLNDGNQGFLNASFLLGAAFEYDARAVASEDLDGDGRRDLLVVEHNVQKARDYLHVYLNRSETSGSWIGVRLAQGRRGPALMGTKVLARSGTRNWIYRVVSGDSNNAQHAPTVHFGLGQVAQIDEIEIRWPDGQVTRLKQPQLGIYHTVESP